MKADYSVWIGVGLALIVSLSWLMATTSATAQNVTADSTRYEIAGVDGGVLVLDRSSGLVHFCGGHLRTRKITQCNVYVDLHELIP